MDHRDLTGASAIHPAFFVGATDPSLDADNHVTADKGWLDTTVPTAPTLKVRNTANDAWISVLGPVAIASISISVTELIVAYTFASYLMYDLPEVDFVELEYVP